MALVRDVGFAQAYSFKYSPRPGTPAAGAGGQVPEAEKDRRLQALQALLREQQARFNADRVGSTMNVLFTGAGRHPGQIVGRSRYLQPVHISAPASFIGDERAVLIREAHPNSLSGTLVEEKLSA
jgi:tRNA-2-methylthio-N6-dimethylallyladenosine synthase